MKFDFEVNVGKTDRIVRIGVGVLLLLLAITGTIGAWGYLLGLIGVGTGFIRFCPAYKLLKMDTCEKA